MADISINKSRGKKYLGGASPMVPAFIVGDDPIPLNPPGSVPTTLYKLLGDVTDADFIGKNGFVPVVNDENVLTLEPLPQLQENGLISGGIVQWTGIGYIFNVSGAFYRIGGVAYESPAIQITLATPDVTNNRIDVFAVNSSGVALAITGTPSGSPVKPQIDPQTQLELTSVIVTASSTVPTLTEEVIYDENTEWTGSSTGTGTVVFNSAVDPFQGSVSIEAANIQNGLKIRLTDGSDYDLSTVQTLGFQINLKATMGAGINIGVTFLNSSGSAISTELILNHDKSLLGYQFVGIALTQFSFTSFLARSIEFRYIRTKGTIIYSGFFLDIIKLEGGINPPLGVSSFLALSDTPSTYSGQAGKTVAVKADESGLEFVTGGGGGITGSGTTNEIAYFTGASAIASLPVATYPSLTEHSYMKGVTSAVQTQINGKQATIAGTLTDTYVATIVAGVPTWQAASGGGISGLTTNKIPKANSATTIGDSGITEESAISYLYGTRVPGGSATPLKVSFGGSYGNNTTGSSGNLKWALYEDGTPANSYGIGMSTNLMEIRAGGVSGAIQFFPANGLASFKIRSDGDVELPDAYNLRVKSIVNSSGGAATIVRFFSSVLVQASSGMANLSLGSSFGVAAAGSGDNVKLHLYQSGANSNSYGFGISSNLLEIRTPTNGAIGFFPIGVESMRILSTGVLQFADAKNISFNATTGTKIGTATTQKIAFWNKTPIIQPTTAITGAAKVAGGGVTVTDTDTFGGYTIAKIAAALINTGILA